MGVSVLGPLDVDGRGQELGRRDRVVLSALVVGASDPLTTEQLADALWGDAPPASWTKVVQGCVVRLRKLLGSAAIESGGFGYRLTLTEAELDCARFERGVARARQALEDGDPERAAYAAGEALGLWRGRPFADLDDWAPGRARAEQLEGLRRDAEELYVEAKLSSGRAASVLQDAQALVDSAPYRERRWVLLATALHQAGRQAEALAAIQRARSLLADELGLDPGQELRELEVQLLRQDPSLAPRAGREISATCPYQGLRPYGQEDADTYYGRDEDVASALRRLRDVGTLAVVGPSGIGKSSLVRAGVAATLLRDGRRVLITSPGRHPLATLSGLGSGQVLVVDQAEEAITICPDADERAAYFEALSAHAAAGHPLVLSLRADHLGDLAPYPAIGRLIEEGLVLLGPMGEPALRRAIEGPAARAGLRLEPGLVDLLIRDVDGEPAALPLLSHVLRETWLRREGPTLTVEAYRATGGVQHAVAQSAESLYESLNDPQQDCLRGLLLRLVQPREDGEPIRTLLPRDKVAIDDGHAMLLERLVAARLVTVDADSVQIAHEALLREWPRLRGWLESDIEGRRLFRHLTGAADAWAALGRPNSELYRGVRLSRALDWRDRSLPDLDRTERDFLMASKTLHQIEERVDAVRLADARRANRWLRGALGAVAAVLVVAVVTGIAALGAAGRARESQDSAVASARVALARHADAQALTTEAPVTGLLLAVAALAEDPSAQARDTLATLLSRHDSLVALRDLHGIRSVTVGKDLVAVSDASGGVALFDAETLEPRDFPDRTPIDLVRLSPDGTSLVAARIPDREYQPNGPYVFVGRPVLLYELPSGRLADEQLGGASTGSDVETGLEFSADGSRVVAALRRWDLAARDWSRRGSVAVWDLADRADPVFSVELPALADAVLSPDGHRVYAVTEGAAAVRVYDVDSGDLVGVAEVQLPSGGPRVADLRRDGSLLAVASGDRIQLVDPRSLEPRGPALAAATDEIVDLRFSPDGHLLLAAAADGTAEIWDTRSGAERAGLVPGRRATTSALTTEDAGAVWEAAFSSDGTSVFTATEDLAQWDLTGLRGLYAGTSPPPSGGELVLAAPGPGGRTVARQDSEQLSFVDVDTGRSTTPVRVAPPAPGATAWSPDGQRFATGGSDGILRVWDARTGTQLAQRRAESVAGWAALAFDDAGDRIYAVEGERSQLQTLDADTLAVLGDPAVIGFGVQTRALLPDRSTGTILVVLDQGFVLRVRPDGGSATPEDSRGWVPTDFPIASGSGVPALSPDGTHVVSLDAERRIRALDLRTAEWLEPATAADRDSDLAFVYSPDGTQVATASEDRIRLFDGATAQYQASVPLPQGASGARIAYLPDSSGLLVTSLDGRIWKLPTRTDAWVSRACALAGRDLTTEEWSESFPGLSQRAACPAPA